MNNKAFHISNILGSLLLLAAASCSDFEQDMPRAGQSLSLQVVTTETSVTRTTPGDDALNENRFVCLDYFFFAQNADDATLLLHKTEGTRLASGNSTLDISSHTYNGTLSDADVAAIFGDAAATTGQCYVYVLVNLLAETRTAIQTEGALTLGTLKHIDFQDTGISANAAQECFVMYGGGMVSLTMDETTYVKTLGGNPIMVTRDAAKVKLTVTEMKDTVWVATETGAGLVTDGDGNTYAIWKSDPKNSYVMFYSGKTKSNVHSQINPGMHYVPQADEPDDLYFDLTSKNSLWRRLAATGTDTHKNLSHDFPFYTYLTDWREASGSTPAGADPESYMILVVPWQQVYADGNPIDGAGFQNTYYQIQTSTTQTYYENYYYQILINVGVLGSFEIPEPVELEGTYMIVPWGTKDVDATLREPKYLIVETNAYTVNNVSSASIPYITSHDITEAYVKKVSWIALKTFTGFDENSRTNTNKNNPFTTNTYVSNESFSVSTDDGYLTLTHNISASQYTAYQVEVVIKNAKDLEETVVFTIYPAIYADRADGDDVFIYGHFGHVNTPVSSVAQGNTNYWYQVTGSYYKSANSTNVTTGFGGLITTAPSDLNQLDLIRIKISNFNSSDEIFRINNTQYKYKIGDPRVASGWTTDYFMTQYNGTNQGYLVTASSNRSTRTYATLDASKVMKGGSDQESIAPEIFICSLWGRVKDGSPSTLNFELAQKRCATYQEAGYPAGRWRLPTEAELSFIYGLQSLGVINTLFNTSQKYWASSGRYVSGYNTSTKNATFNDGGSSSCTLRCVYDVWYWGEEKMSANEYHAEP